MGSTRQDPVDRTLRAFGTWSRRGGCADPHSADALDLLLRVRRDYLDPDLGCWTADMVAELLLEVCPRKVTADSEFVAGAPTALSDFLRFLADTGALAGDPPQALRAAIATASARFPAAMADTSRFGMAKSFMVQMLADGVDPGDPEGMQGWMDQFNDRPRADRRSFTDPLLAGGPRPDAFVPPPAAAQTDAVLPPVVLRPREELRESAKGAVLLTRVEALLAFVGPEGRPVTQTGSLRLVDAQALAADLGDARWLAARADRQLPLRRMAELPGVTEAYELTVTAELLSLSATRVRRCPGHPAYDDPLERAALLADAALDRGVWLGQPPVYAADVGELVDEALPSLLAMLYAAGEPVPLDELVAEVSHGCGCAVRDMDLLLLGVRGQLDSALARLERLAMLSRLGVPPATGDTSHRCESAGERPPGATSVTLTPLGTWWLQRTLPAYGCLTPVVGELAAVGARELCRRLESYPLDAAYAEIRGWIGSRAGEHAARELAELLGGTEPAVRQVALICLDEIGAGAEEAVRAVLDDPAARPFARMWLTSRRSDQATQPLGPLEVLTVYVDCGAVALDAGGPGVLAEQLALVGESEEQARMVRELWRVDSPHTERVLDALAAAAGDKRVAKAARKALFSLRSVRHERTPALRP